MAPTPAIDNLAIEIPAIEATPPVAETSTGLIPSLLVKFHPAGPWRLGPESGDRRAVEGTFHSDSLFSAVTLAMRDLGQLDDWLAATVETPQVALTSLFPFQDSVLYAIPPASHWPPPPSSRLYYNGARFTPLSLVRYLLDDESIDEDRWIVDISSQCLIAANRFGRTGGPFLPANRLTSPTDRLTGQPAPPDSLSCLEFRENSGFWGAVRFSDTDAFARWSDPLQGAFRYLADSGIGGGRARGWGRSRSVEFRSGELQDLLLPPRRKLATETLDAAPKPTTLGYWLLSMYAPAAADPVDWKSGYFSLATRSGRTGIDGQLNQRLRLVEEGSVLVSPRPPVGSVKNVAPAGHPHPVYRSGLAVALPIPLPVSARLG